MDAVKFVKTLQRKIKNENRSEIIIRTTDDANLFVDLVEQWSEEHPYKTRQSEFMKIFPNAGIDDDGVLNIYPCDINTNLYDACECSGRLCDDCQHSYWLQEVE